MRIFLVFLVLLNLLYAAWEYLNPAGLNDSVPSLEANLKSLELLHEVKVEPESLVDIEDEVVSEATSEQLVEDKQSQSEDLPIVENIENERVASCFTLGPFKDENIMRQLSDSISQHVRDISVRKRQESEKHRYWVHVPSLSSRKQAKLMAQKLRQKKIKDFYIVLKGDAKNSISLGHFRKPAHANRRMKHVIDKGFRAEINVIYRSYDIYWLDYQLKTEVTGDAVSAEFSIDEYVTEGVSQLVRQCEDS